MDGGGRAVSGTAAESNAGAVAEVEPRLEQRPRATQEQFPDAQERRALSQPTIPNAVLRGVVTSNGNDQ
jgi:hypothetical protein